MSLVEFSQTPYGRDFFRNVQKISDSLEEIAKDKTSKSMHEHRVGAAQRISLVIGYINENIEAIKENRTNTHNSEIYFGTVLDTLEAVRKILLKST